MQSHLKMVLFGCLFVFVAGVGLFLYGEWQERQWRDWQARKQLMQESLSASYIAVRYFEPTEVNISIARVDASFPMPFGTYFSEKYVLCQNTNYGLRCERETLWRLGAFFRIQADELPPEENGTVDCIYRKDMLDYQAHEVIKTTTMSEYLLRDLLSAPHGVRTELDYGQKRRLTNLVYSYDERDGFKEMIGIYCEVQGW